MTKYVALLLAALCSGLARGLVICTNTTYAEYYFQWCLADPVCQENLHLFEDDLWTFTETFNGELLEPMGLTGNSTCDPIAMPFWHGLLRTVNLCYPNHFRDPSGVCILRPGREEDPAADFRTGFSGVLTPFMLAALAAEFIWLVVRELDAWKAIFISREETEQQARRNAKVHPTSPPQQPPNNTTTRPTAVQGVIHF